MNIPEKNRFLSVYWPKPNERKGAHRQTTYQTIPYDLLHLSMLVSTDGSGRVNAGVGSKGSQMLKKWVFLVQALSECWQNTKLIVLAR